MGAIDSETRKEALRLGSEFITDAHPEILSVTQVATHVAEVMGMTLPAARRQLRASIPTGQLIELIPSSNWAVTWVQAQRSGVGMVWLVREKYQVDDKHESTRLVLAADRYSARPSYYGPGAATFLTTPRLAAAFLRRVRKDAKIPAQRRT